MESSMIKAYRLGAHGWTRRSMLAVGGAALLSVVTKSAEAQLMPNESQGFCDVPGGKIFWRKFGSGNKTPLLVLHGGPGAAHNYMLSIKALAATGHPVIFYDQLGCGKADAPADDALYTIQRSVDELDAVRQALGLDAVILVGHSWGAFLAIEFVCQGRGAVEKLVLSGASASTPQVVAGQQRLIASLPDGFAAELHELENTGRTQSPGYAALTKRFYDHFVLRVPPTPDALVSFASLEKSIAYRVMNGPNEFSITGVIKDWDRRGDLRKIAQPTLITTGQYDEITIDCHTTIRDGIGGPHRLTVMAGCSHLTMVEQPERYNALLQAFLSDA
jgi:proline iminopeptidase